jgi:hypothetical protein
LKDDGKENEEMMEDIAFEFETPHPRKSVRIPEEGDSESSPQKRKKDMYSWDEKFVWNFYLIKDLLPIIKFKKWILPLVHGYINMLSKPLVQFYLCNIDLEYHAKKMSVILIGRRSRHFAGVRYLRRGIDHEGNVANFVETEQIVYNPNKSFDDKATVSSFVLIRGSIPLFWTQDPNPLIPKPEIICKQA